MDIENRQHNRSLMLCILLGFLIPQVVLLALNIYAWQLVAGEAGEREVFVVSLLCGAEVLLLAMTLGAAAALQHRKILPGLSVAIFSLMAHTGYMYLFVFYVHEAIPSSIQPWIIDEGNIGRWTFTLLMPGAFLSLYRVSGLFFSQLSGRESAGLAVISMLAVPILWYLITAITQPLLLGQYGDVLGIIITTILVVVFLAATIRVFDTVVHRQTSSNLPEQHYIVAGLLAIAAPLGGLYLNSSIPFPVDFQATSIYVLTIFNGLIQLIKPGGTRFTLTRLFLRCLAFPFILYFFLVFLPFLPLSIFAILAMGAGFLMLTPLALGLFQARLTWQDFEVARKKSAAASIAVSIIGLSILPGYFVLQANVTKNALDKSLSYFYAHDLNASPLSQFEIDRSAEALLQLRDRKDGIQLPYISGFYNKVVFGDMVMSDKKISNTYQLLTGAELPSPNDSSFFGSQRGGRGARFGVVVAPTRDVILDEWVLEKGAADSSTLKLTLKNETDETHSLYVGDLHIPEGVFVTALRLKIEGEWVDGQLFDKKTALWVFQKITEVRKDPALLYYKSPNVLELRVYPFPADGVREVEIDFITHPAMIAKIHLDETSIALNGLNADTSLLTSEGFKIPLQEIQQSSFVRKPYLHAILDFSSGAVTDENLLAKRIAQVGRELGLKQVSITAANISMSAMDNKGLLSIDKISDLEEVIKNISLEPMAGLWVEPAIAKVMIEASENIDGIPVAVVLTDKYAGTLQQPNLEPWRHLVPDMPYWYIYSPNELVKLAISESDTIHQAEGLAKNAVVAIRQRGEITVFPTDRTALFSAQVNDGLEIYRHDEKRFVPISLLPNTVPVSSSWPSLASVWQDWRTASLSTAVLEESRAALHQSSKSNGVLLPVTSFIVVESSSQWEILKRKEKQSLANHSALDFEDTQETSEPGWLLLLCLLLGYLYWKDGWRRSGSVA